MVYAAGGRSSDSGLPLCRLPSPASLRTRASGFRRRATPLTAAGPSRTCTGFPYRSPIGRSLTWSAMYSTRLLSTWAPVVLWAGLIFGLSSVPNLGTDLGTWDLVLRKLAHFGEYAVLGLLLVRAFGREPLAAAAGVAYAATDELHQHFVRGRHAAFRDVAIDSAGVLAGLLLARRFRWR